MRAELFLTQWEGNGTATFRSNDQHERHDSLTSTEKLPSEKMKLFVHSTVKLGVRTQLHWVKPRKLPEVKSNTVFLWRTTQRAYSSEVRWCTSKSNFLDPLHRGISYLTPILLVEIFPYTAGKAFVY
jgi:hypothetical protein